MKRTVVILSLIAILAIVGFVVPRTLLAGEGEAVSPSTIQYYRVLGPLTDAVVKADDLEHSDFVTARSQVKAESYVGGVWTVLEWLPYRSLQNEFGVWTTDYVLFLPGRFLAGDVEATASVTHSGSNKCFEVSRQTWNAFRVTVPWTSWTMVAITGGGVKTGYVSWCM